MRAWLKERGFGFWLMTTILGGVIGWGISQAMPALWREISKPEPIAVDVQPNPAGVTAPPTPPETTNLGKKAQLIAETDPTIFEKGEPDWLGYTWVLPLDISEVPKPVSEPSDDPIFSSECRDRRDWALGLGGVDANRTVIQVTLEGKATGTVLVDGIEVDVLNRSAPMKGTWARCPIGGADVVPTRGEIDLDRDPPRVVFYKPAADVAKPLEQLRFTLTRGEVEVFHIWAETQKGYYEWRLRLLLVVDGERREVVVDDNGEPFRTTATSRAVPAEWKKTAWKRCHYNYNPRPGHPYDPYC